MNLIVWLKILIDICCYEIYFDDLLCQNAPLQKTWTRKLNDNTGIENLSIIAKDLTVIRFGMPSIMLHSQGKLQINMSPYQNKKSHCLGKTW